MPILKTARNHWDALKQIMNIDDSAQAVKWFRIEGGLDEPLTVTIEYMPKEDKNAD